MVKSGGAAYLRIGNVKYCQAECRFRQHRSYTTRKPIKQYHMIIHNETVATAGAKLSAAKKVLIMLHGRGDRADSFIDLARKLTAPDFAFLACFCFYFGNHHLLTTTRMKMSDTNTLVLVTGAFAAHRYWG